MSAEEIQLKAAVWRMVGELGFEEAHKRLSNRVVKVASADLERVRKTADILDEEADSWACSFAAQIEGKWVFPPDDPVNKHAHVRYIKLTSASDFLRNFSVRMDRQIPVGAKAVSLNPPAVLATPLTPP